ncbi:hypothetical protein F4804DRAFT_86966 [Jackrogersella minutella]|nr:hypothetical protein F4804DRAFT_86966 [Jackrogersella minutella]
MPALSPTLLLDALVGRNVTLDSAASSLPSNATNVENVMQVICAWPVSGQYGPGSRFLYYALVAACVLARKAEWLRNACLAAALVFPAVAALHGIILTILHVDGAVDMDVYGAFQFCSIGILAAPLTVRISRTYFYDPGRNIIFIWTGIVLAGLLSLTVEFFRLTPSPCTQDDNGNLIDPHDFNNFPYGNASCNLTCSTEAGPFSPLRQGSTNDIFLIPAPNILAFNAATLLAAACCIPAVLSLASMWNKILEINWKTRFGRGDEDQLIEGTNGATVERMSKVNTAIRLFLSTVEVPVFAAAVLAILSFGEKNFWSPQVIFQTEPMVSVGQWAPLAGTALAALGSLYVLLAVDLNAIKETTPGDPTHHCNCSHHHFDSARHPSSQSHIDSSGSVEADSTHGGTLNFPEHDSRSSLAMREAGDDLVRGSSNSITVPDAARLRSSSSNSRREVTTEIARSETHPPIDIGNRRKVAQTLRKVSDYLGTAAHDRFDDSEFKHGKALDFPEVPAEEMRNPDLPNIRERYNQYHEENLTSALSIRPSRSGSFVGSVASGYSIDGNPSISRVISAPHPPSRSPSPSPAILGVRHASTLPVGPRTNEPQNPASPSAAVPIRGRPRQRRDTLEVPVPTHHSTSWGTQSASPASLATTIPNDQGSPTIVISPDPDTNSARPSIESIPPQTKPSPPL